VELGGKSACIVGVGTSESFGFDQGKSPLTLQTESFLNALADASLQKSDIDGFATAHGSPRSGCFRSVAQSYCVPCFNLTQAALRSLDRTNGEAEDICNRAWGLSPAYK